MKKGYTLGILEPYIDDMTFLHIMSNYPNSTGNYAIYDGLKKDMPVNLWNKYLESIDSLGGCTLQLVIQSNRREDL